MHWSVPACVWKEVTWVNAIVVTLEILPIYWPQSPGKHLGERRGEEMELLTSAKAMRASICFIGEKLHGDREKQVAGSLSNLNPKP